jgi:hypothetical protein
MTHWLRVIRRPILKLKLKGFRKDFLKKKLRMKAIMTHFRTEKLKPIRWAIHSNLVKVTRWLRDSRKLILTVKPRTMQKVKLKHFLRD